MKTSQLGKDTRALILGLGGAGCNVLSEMEEDWLPLGKLVTTTHLKNTS